MSSGGTLSTPLPSLRVTLARPSAGAASAISGWFDGAWSDILAVSGERPGMLPTTTPGAWCAGAPGLERRLIELNGLPIGLIGFSDNAAELVFYELATAPAHRDRGFGAEAVYTLEAISGRTAASALVPLTNGLAVYFWLRIGYRPQFLSEHERRGFTVMHRVLT